MFEKYINRRTLIAIFIYKSDNVGGMPKKPLDAKDRRILTSLREDARLPIRDIAKKTGLRPSTVHDRLKRLLAEGVIKHFTAKLNNAAVGEGFVVFMLVKTKPAKQLEQAAFDSAHVKEVFGVTGEYDLLLKLKFADVVEFNSYVLRFRNNPSIITTLTMVATAEVKEEL